MAMLPLASVADCPWVKVLDAIPATLENPDLPFRPFCVREFGRAPVVFARRGEAVDQGVVWTPEPGRWPAVVLTPYSSPPFDNEGTGLETWSLAYTVETYYEIRNKDHRIALAANYELVRTLFAYFRTGSLNQIRTATSQVKSYRVNGDLTPTFNDPARQTHAKTFFALLITLSDALLG